jgi:hypothetical protein
MGASAGSDQASFATGLVFNAYGLMNRAPHCVQVLGQRVNMRMWTAICLWNGVMAIDLVRHCLKSRLSDTAKLKIVN